MSLRAGVPFPTTYWVVPGQFLAGEHPVEFSEDLTLVRLNALLDAGIRTFVNLTEETERMRSYSNDMRKLAVERNISVDIVRVPIRDRNVPSAEFLISILDLIDRSIAQRKPVFVHCFAGIGRTGTVVGCYLKRHGIATQQDVIRRIGELRSGMTGAEEPSPHTTEQVELVENWKEEPR